MVTAAFDIVAGELAGRTWAAGDRFGIADAALFYVERWAPQADVTLPAAVEAHLQRMKEHPAVARVMEIWGEK